MFILERMKKKRENIGHYLTFYDKELKVYIHTYIHTYIYTYIHNIDP